MLVIKISLNSYSASLIIIFTKIHMISCNVSAKYLFKFPIKLAEFEFL